MLWWIGRHCFHVPFVFLYLHDVSNATYPTTAAAISRNLKTVFARLQASPEQAVRDKSAGVPALADGQAGGSYRVRDKASQKIADERSCDPAANFVQGLLSTPQQSTLNKFSAYGLKEHLHCTLSKPFDFATARVHAGAHQATSNMSPNKNRIQPAGSPVSWIIVQQQVITTMNFFPRCDFVRVIVATTLFGRLVDLENIDEILEEFSQVSPMYHHCNGRLEFPC